MIERWERDSCGEYLVQEHVVIIVGSRGKIDCGSTMMQCGDCSNEGGAVYAEWKGGGCFEGVGIQRLGIPRRNPAKSTNQGEH